MAQKSDFLPTSRDEIDALGWDRPDVIIFTVMPMWTTLRLEL